MLLLSSYAPPVSLVRCPQACLCHVASKSNALTVQTEQAVDGLISGHFSGSSMGNSVSAAKEITAINLLRKFCSSEAIAPEDDTFWRDLLEGFPSLSSLDPVKVQAAVAEHASSLVSNNGATCNMQSLLIKLLQLLGTAGASLNTSRAAVNAAALTAALLKHLSESLNGTQLADFATNLADVPLPGSQRPAEQQGACLSPTSWCGVACLALHVLLLVLCLCCLLPAQADVPMQRFVQMSFLR